MSTQLTICDCRDQDLVAIAAIEADVYTLEGPWDVDDYREELLDPGCIALVATAAGGLLAGYAFARIEESVVEIIALTTAEGFRRLGIGRLLLAELLRRGREAGAATSVLDVREGNIEATHLYTTFGFRPVSRTPDLYDTGIHAVEMQLQLP